MFGNVFPRNYKRSLGIVSSVEIHKNINEQEKEFKLLEENCKIEVYFKQKIKKIDIEGELNRNFKKIEQNNQKMQKIPK